MFQQDGFAFVGQQPAFGQPRAPQLAQHRVANLHRFAAQHALQPVGVADAFELTGRIGQALQMLARRKVKIEAMGVASTSTTVVFSEPSTRAEIVARPALTAVTRPSWVTPATRGAELRQRGTSARGSPDAEKACASSRSR